MADGDAGSSENGDSGNQDTQPVDVEMEPAATDEQTPAELETGDSSAGATEGEAEPASEEDKRPLVYERGKPRPGGIGTLYVYLLVEGETALAVAVAEPGSGQGQAGSSTRNWKVDAQEIREILKGQPALEGQLIGRGTAWKLLEKRDLTLPDPLPTSGVPLEELWPAETTG